MFSTKVINIVLIQTDDKSIVKAVKRGSLGPSGKSVGLLSFTFDLSLKSKNGFLTFQRMQIVSQQEP